MFFFNILEREGSVELECSSVYFQEQVEALFFTDSAAPAVGVEAQNDFIPTLQGQLLQERHKVPSHSIPLVSLVHRDQAISHQYLLLADPYLFAEILHSPHHLRILVGSHGAVGLRVWIYGSWGLAGKEVFCGLERSHSCQRFFASRENSKEPLLLQCLVEGRVELQFPVLSGEGEGRRGRVGGWVELQVLVCDQIQSLSEMNGSQAPNFIMVGEGRGFGAESAGEAEDIDRRVFTDHQLCDVKPYA